MKLLGEGQIAAILDDANFCRRLKRAPEEKDKVLCTAEVMYAEVMERIRLRYRKIDDPN